MNQDIIKTIAEELTITNKQVEAVLFLLEQGNIVTFIVCFRK